MTAFASLNGQRVVKASICIPMYGAWSADVDMDNPADIPLNVTLTIANLSLVGRVYRMASFAGGRSARIVGGYGGWRKTVPVQAYYKTGGVKRSTVLGDVAALVGEKIKITTDQTIGTYFIRELAPAERTLRQVLGSVWYIDEKGVTQCQARTNSALIKSEFTVGARSGGQGRIEIASEDIASWMPGRTFDTPVLNAVQTISTTTIQADNAGKLRLEILTTGDTYAT